MIAIHCEYKKVYWELDVNISKLTNSLLVATLLSISIEVTAADSEYPATDFQPKVVYQDEGYKHSGSDSSKSSSSSSSKKKVGGEVSSADPDYPAANFQPEVLYQDDGYKHSAGSTSSTRSSSKSKTSSGESSSANEEIAEDSSMSLIIGLALLAAAGFAFYSKNLKQLGGKGAGKKGKARRRQVAKKSAAAPVLSGSESGVARYLEDKNGVEPSGVAKYLDERSTSVSGVSKYVAKQKITARVASVTGVEKYLKDNG